MRTQSTGGRTRPLSLLLLPLVIALVGCGEELGAESFPVARVDGAVVESGRGVPGGWIEFVPVEGTRGRIRSARIRSDGSFQVDRVPVGKVVIRLVNARIQLPGGRPLFGNYSTTPIRRTIAARQDAPLRIDLLDEAIRYQARRTRMNQDQATDAARGTNP